ncbi:amidase [Pelomonas sp. SE-A7]|uniref:amidase n=1 Tax=Pelomonas sp. SE-A7 TaxID=3054953 RepID=UPI00259C8555|nr:amidase [Pelomonas sp. SE-A7]MDM4766537.1 amidase [Pelomonas sp. SE-A7]
MQDLWRLPALDLARHIASRELSAVEVVDAHLQRIAELNPHLNAIVHVLDGEARAAARAADARAARGEPLPPLHGVPFTVKANIDMAGQATTWGVAPLAHAVVPLDAPVVERMRAAGAIPIGRTNLPDMALRVHTDSSLHGLTLNPWNPQRSCAGSSGGEAVALATGMAALGLGNDIGGSLRNPASACGIASIRPSYGRVPDAGLVPHEEHLLAVQLMNVQGPMARRVADLRVALDVISGAHPRDPASLDLPPARRRGPVRVAVLAEPPGGRTDPAIAAVVRRSAQALAAAGYEVEELTPPRYEEAVATWARLLIGDFGAVLPQLLPLMGEDAQRFLVTAGQGVPPLDNPLAMSGLMLLRDGIARAWSQFLDRTPLILSPTWTQLPFELGFDVATPEGTAATIEMMRPVVPANLLGLPSACVPAGRDAATGLPIGVLLTGARYQDELCLDAAEVIERQGAVVTPIDPVRA